MGTAKGHNFPVKFALQNNNVTVTPIKFEPKRATPPKIAIFDLLRFTVILQLHQG